MSDKQKIEPRKKVGMKRFMRGIYLIPLLWIAWVFYHWGRLKSRGAVAFRSSTGERIVKEWNGTDYVSVPPDAFGEFFYSLLIFATLIWIFLGAVRLVIRFFVRTIQEEKQKIEPRERIGE